MDYGIGYIIHNYNLILIRLYKTKKGLGDCIKMVKYKDIKISPSDAFELYMEKYPKTKVKEVELELKSNSYVYKIKGYDDEKKYEIYVDPANGTITQTKEKIFKGKHKDINKKNTDEIQELVDKALKESGKNSEINEWSLEIEDGILELKVKIKLENQDIVEYKYDIDSGELMKKE